jgi:hypothetical protein
MSISHRDMKTSFAKLRLLGAALVAAGSVLICVGKLPIEPDPFEALLRGCLI